MVILTLGAFRFSGLQADVPSLPLNIEAGAIFDAVDSVRKYVFDGGAWNEFVAGTGEINEMANVGVGTGLIFRDKIGVTFNVKSLIGGSNITVTDNLDDITISSTGTSPLTTKGDLLSFDTIEARLPVGTDGQILSANSAIAIGLEWIDDVQEVFTWTANHDANGFALEDSKFADGTDPTKILALDLLNMTTGITLTLLSAQTTIQTLVIPDITQADTLVTEKFAQTLALKTLDLPIITDYTNATHDHLTTVGGGLLAGVYSGITGIGIQTQTLDMGINLIDNVTRIAVGEIFDETNAFAAITITDFTAAMNFNSRVITGFDFDANGTLNSLVNVEVEDLANAVAGELITWDSGGAPAVVPVGTSGDILTSNGVGQAPTFQPGGAGGGGAWNVIGDYEASIAENSITFNFTTVTFDDDSEIVVVFDASSESSALEIRMTLNGNTSPVYFKDGIRIEGGSITPIDDNSQNFLLVASLDIIKGSQDNFFTALHIGLNKGGTIQFPIFQWVGYGSFNNVENVSGDLEVDQSSISSIEITTNGPNWNTGTRITVYKVSRT